MTEFAKTLRRLAQLAGKSEYQLAAISGLDAAYVRRLMTGEKRNPSPATVLKLAFALVASPELVRRQPLLLDAPTSLMGAMLQDAATRLPAERR